MAPTCLPGDVAVIHECQTFGIGDVVLVDLADGSSCVHRVAARSGHLYVTRGDANRVADRDLVRPAQVRGIMVGRIAFGELLGGWITRVSGGTLHNQSHS